MAMIVLASSNHTVSFTVINKIKKHRCIIILWLIDSSSSDLD